MFTELKEAFFGKLPNSYMIAYKYSENLQLLCDQYGITLIDPLKEYPDSEDYITAFKNFLKDMLEEARVKKFDNEMKEFFTPTSSYPIKVIRE